MREIAAVTGGQVFGDPEQSVSDVKHDSRDVGADDLFVAIRGLTSDGHRFVPVAVENNAAAVMVDHGVAAEVAQVVVPDTRLAMAPVAALVHGSPSKVLPLIGVTGTNGKTTVCHLIGQIAAQAGIAAGVIGTLGAGVGSRFFVLKHTTPESTDFQRLLAQMVAEGAEMAAAEISSHALALGRADATSFRVAAFTNLSQDHLDFHANMDDYFKTKTKLFSPSRSQSAVINIADDYGRRLADMVEVPTLTVGEGGDVRSKDIELGAAGSRFGLVTPAGSRSIELPLFGRFNVSNALVAAAAALQAGIELDAVVEGLSQAQAPSGRFEPVVAGQDFTVIVDYAHTPDGISAAIESARLVSQSRIIAVVGAGGDRDRSKRKGMGKAGSRADLLIVTSDNPRSEDPDRIIKDIVRGVSPSTEMRIEADRRTAIATAISSATPGDVVLILGKGHETGQDIGGVLLPFDDREVARELLGEERPR